MKEPRISGDIAGRTRRRSLTVYEAKRGLRHFTPNRNRAIKLLQNYCNYLYPPNNDPFRGRNLLIFNNYL